MKIKFRTFRPGITTFAGGKITVSAAENLNSWLEENPDIEIISWQATPVGTTNEIYITIQYREFVED
jgi:hypothetical protein